jgi:hypothetical protein
VLWSPLVEQQSPLSGRGKGVTERRTYSAGERPNGTEEAKVRASFVERDEVGNNNFGLEER